MVWTVDSREDCEEGQRKKKREDRIKSHEDKIKNSHV
jgi:hypothetical protein